MTLLLFSAVIFFIAVSDGMCSGRSAWRSRHFSWGSRIFCLSSAGLCHLRIGGTRLREEVDSGALDSALLLLVIAAFLIVHTATSAEYFGRGFGGYLSACWRAAETDLANGTGGGVLFGLIVYPVRAVLSTVGAYIFFSLLAALAIWLILIATPLRAHLLPSARMRKPQKAAPAEKQPMKFDDLPEPEHAAMPSAQPSAAAPAEGAPVYGYSVPTAPAYNTGSVPPQMQPPAPQPVRSMPSYAAPQPVQSMPQMPPAQNMPRPQTTAQNAPAEQDVLHLRRADGRPYYPPKQDKQEGDAFADLPSDPHERSRAILFRNGDPASSYKNNLIFDRDSRFNTYPRRSSVGYSETEPAQSAHSSGTSSPYLRPHRRMRTALRSGARRAIPNSTRRTRPERGRPCRAR